MGISKINGVDIAGIAKINGISIGNIAKINGIEALLAGFGLIGSTTDFAEAGENYNAIAVKADLTMIWIIAPVDDEIKYGTMSTPGDLSTLSALSTQAMSNNYYDTMRAIVWTDSGDLLVIGSQYLSVDRLIDEAASTPYDVTTLGGIINSPTAGGESANGLKFSSDGFNMGHLAWGGTVRYYSLSTAYDISTLSLLGSFTIDASLWGQFDDDGNFYYIINNRIDLIELETPWDYSTALEVVTLGNLGDPNVSWKGFDLIVSGTVVDFYIVDSTTGEQYLHHFRSITTAVSEIWGSVINNSSPLISSSQSVSGCCVGDGETILLMGGVYVDEIWVFTGTDVTDYTYSYTQAMANTYHNAIRSLRFNNDGTMLFIGSSETPINITSMPLSTAYDLTTIGSITEVTLTDSPYSLTLNSDGTKLAINHRNSSYTVGSWVTIYTLSTAWDITTMSEDGSISIGDVTWYAALSPDGKYIFAINNTSYKLDVIKLTGEFETSVNSRDTALTMAAPSSGYSGLSVIMNGSDYRVFVVDASYGGEDIVVAVDLALIASAATTIYATIDSSYIDSTLTNFPLEILITGEQGFLNGKASTDWQYLHVTVASVECYVEVVDWNVDNGTAILRVRVPSVSSSADTTLEITYGALNTGTYVGQVASTAGQTVWTGYEAVYHQFNGPADSSPNAVDGTDSSVTYTKVNNHFCANFDSTSIYTTVSLVLTGDYTVSFLYMRIETTIAYHSIITNNTTGDALTCIAMDDIALSRTIAVDSDLAGTIGLEANPVFNGNQWYHVTVTRNGSTTEIFVDGVSITSGSAGTDTFTITHLGHRPVSSNHHIHKMSDVRIIESVLSDAEIKAMANNMLGNLVGISA